MDDVPLARPIPWAIDGLSRLEQLIFVDDVDRFVDSLGCDVWHGLGFGRKLGVGVGVGVRDGLVGILDLDVAAWQEHVKTGGFRWCLDRLDSLVGLGYDLGGVFRFERGHQLVS